MPRPFASSGSITSRASRLSSSSSPLYGPPGMPYFASESSILSSSSRMRSGDMSASPAAQALAASNVPRSASKPSSEAKRAMRIMRRASSPIMTAGSFEVALSSLFLRSCMPPVGSVILPVSMFLYMAFTVKSRRKASSFMSPE